jgi:hypothetical protein
LSTSTTLADGDCFTLTSRSGSVTVNRERASPTSIHLLLQLAGVLVVVATLIVGSVLAVALWLTVAPDHGICRVSEDACDVSPLATLEQYTDVRFPAGTQVMRSFAAPEGQGGFGVQSVSAVLRLPRGSRVPMLDDAEPAALDHKARAALREEGAASITGSRSDRTSLFAGTANGRTLIYVWTAYGQL